MAFPFLLSFCMFSVLLYIFPCLPVYFLFPFPRVFLLHSILLTLCLCNPFCLFVLQFTFSTFLSIFFSLFPTSFSRVFISFLCFCFFLFQSYFLIYLSLMSLFYFLYPGILSVSCVRHTCTLCTLCTCACAQPTDCLPCPTLSAVRAPILPQTEPFQLARSNLASGVAKNKINFSS